MNKRRTFDYILYDVKDGVATITLNRPKKKNAFSKQLWIELILALRAAVADEDVVVCVMTGSGDYFSSGNDISNNIEARKRGLDSKQYLSFEGESLVKLWTEILIDFPKHLIAAVNGPAIGMGVTTLGLVDVVYASNTATFLTPFVSLGITPETCSSYTFPKIMGYSTAFEMLYFGRKLSAYEAKERGLVSDVFTTDSFRHEVQMRAKKFAAMPRKTLQAAKKLCQATDRQELLDALNKEMEVLTIAAASEEHDQAMKTFFARKSKM